MNVIEYNTDFGPLSAGLENFDGVETTDVVGLSKDAVFPYNSIHKTMAYQSPASISDYDPSEDIDIAIFRPDFGGKLSRNFSANFKFDDFQRCLDWIKKYNPTFSIIQTEPEAIKLLNTSENYVRDSSDQLSRDKIIETLLQMGYKAHLVVIDEADYGVPVHRKFVFYIVTLTDFTLNIPRGLFTATGKGNYNKYRTLNDAISDLDTMGEWTKYASSPKNAYQKHLRNEYSYRVTWHHEPKIRESSKKKIAERRNEKDPYKRKSNGPNIAKADEIIPNLNEDFYRATSTGYSIHPTEDRPLTIREGARILGMPDKLSFDLKTSKAKVGKMLYNNPSPIIGELFGLSLGLM